MAEPPGRLLQQLVAGSGLVSRALWFDRIGSTSTEVARRAADGAPEGLLVLADEQTAGRGRQGRRWRAPPGTSLMASLLLRPTAALDRLALLPLLIGVAVAEAGDVVAPGVQLTLKWPNDLLAGDRKCAGILVEVPSPATVIVGVGINVDWRGVDRPQALGPATSLTEAGGARVDRWALLPALVARIEHHYREWTARPHGVLRTYRERCATLGAAVRVERVDGSVVTGVATTITGSGALVVDTPTGDVVVHAGDVHHLRHP